MDNNQNLIEQARKEYANIPNLEFVTGNIYDTGYKNMFDIVTCSRVIQWLSEPLKAVKAMKDATKQGGKVIVLDYNHEKAHWSPDPPKRDRKSTRLNSSHVAI